jgi:hypothetical protein
MFYSDDKSIDYEIDYFVLEKAGACLWDTFYIF